MEPLDSFIFVIFTLAGIVLSFVKVHISSSIIIEVPFVLVVGGAVFIQLMVITLVSLS